MSSSVQSTTSAGSLPSGWRLRLLGQTARIYSGGTPSRGNQAYWGGDIPWATTAEVDFGLIRSTKEKITKAGLENSATKVAPPGTLLVAMYGQGKTRGKTAILDIHSAMNQACAAVEPNSEISTRFLFHFLKANYDNIRGMSNAGGQENLSGEIVKKIPIAVPTLAEQERIAVVLDDSDALIESMERLIAKKQAIKQGVMQQLLTGKTRLPEFDSPRTWQTVRIAEIADKTVKHSFAGGPFGSSLTTSDYVPNGVRILQLQNIGEGAFKGDYSIFTTEQKADELLSNCIYSGDILIAKMGDPVARACIVPGVAGRFVMASDGIRLAVDKLRFNAQLVKDLLNRPEFREQAEAVSTGTTRKRISLGALRSLSLTLPFNLDEQDAIAAVLADLDNEIRLLRHRLSKSKAFKQGMMQELLTGRTRLRPADVIA